MKQFDVAVCVGRWQPFHKGHAALIDHALDVAQHVIVMLGSSHAARNCKNPFTAEERTQMIVNYVDDAHQGAIERVTVLPMRDYLYNDSLWVTDLQTKVRHRIQPYQRVCLVGHKKDASSYYLNLFPSWTYVAHQPTHKNVDGQVLSATDVRREWLSKFGSTEIWNLYVPAGTAHVIQSLELDRPEVVSDLREQYEYLRRYPEEWGKGPFVTADAVVIKSGHVLVIRRGQIPGKGLLALPGGFVNPDERIVDACVRELREETGLSLYRPEELKRRIVAKEVFDHPQRSERGRTITTAFHIDLSDPDLPGLPAVSGGDDAAEAFWLPLVDALEKPDIWYEDHQHLIRHFVSTI